MSLLRAAELQLTAKNLGDFSREHLFELIWGTYGDRSAVSVYVSRLREKIDSDPTAPSYIVTVWGAGYRFEGNLRRYDAAT